MKRIKIFLSALVVTFNVNSFTFAQGSSISDKNPCIPCKELNLFRAILKKGRFAGTRFLLYYRMIHHGVIKLAGSSFLFL